MTTTDRDSFRTICQNCGRWTWANDADSICDDCGHRVGQFGPSDCAHCGKTVIGGTDLCHSCKFSANVA